MFDLTKDQLRSLGDAHLRELVARLCEAELRREHAPVSAVRWPGAHTAPDGGLDIDCRAHDDFRGDFVPRPRTGFQVKKPTMPPAKIAAEMSPNGKLRSIFSKLAAAKGCYIIVSLNDDPAGDAATRRRNAMRDQVHEVRTIGNLQTEFYGCSELANWLRQHPGVQLWVRDVLGIPLQGWKPFGRWTDTLPDDSDELICKPGVSITLPGKNTSKLDIEHGIECIRDLVRTSEKAVRFVGLSGVGKSRIAQALFEHSVGTNPLDSSLAIHADLGTESIPSPRQVLNRLRAENRPAILVLDNCPADTHNQLAAEACATLDIRLVTIEYDIREDRPEVTTVIRIDAEGTEIVEAFVYRRRPDLGQVNARVIAEFSGGNARIALALAHTVNIEENLSGLSNAHLFDRLFYQRDARDAELLTASQALALVYSYSIDADEDGVDELAVLTGLVGQHRNRLYEATRTLLERQLAQKRGKWRAILPPAVADQLALRALDRIPIDDFRNSFENLPNRRLLKSFGKRLGHLHHRDSAQWLVRTWLSSGGVLHDIESLDDDLIQLLVNTAPVAPDAVLDTIEAQARQPRFARFFIKSDPRSQRVAVLLCKIAYDAALFERCIALLVRFATAQDLDQQPRSDVRNRLCNLFALYLSGTLAEPDTRERVLRQFLFSTRPDERNIGRAMFDVALKSGHWASFATFDFGARPRSFGYRP